MSLPYRGVNSSEENAEFLLDFTEIHDASKIAIACWKAPRCLGGRVTLATVYWVTMGGCCQKFESIVSAVHGWSIRKW